jgi:hypothetical protein
VSADPVSDQGFFLGGRCLSSPCVLTWLKAERGRRRGRDVEERRREGGGRGKG